MPHFDGSPIGSLGFHHGDVAVRVDVLDARHESAVRRLGEDFRNFPTGAGSSIETDIRVVIGSDTRETTRGWGRTRFTPRYRFHPRVCDHGDGTTSRVSRQGRRVSIRIDGVDTDHVYEVAYVAVLAIFGWEIEKRGWTRVHALGVRMDEGVVLFHLASKGGKSTLALECVNGGIEVLGDEVILVRDQCAAAFPIRAAVAGGEGRLFKRKVFDEKTLVALPAVSLEPAAITALVFQSRPGLATSASRAGFADKWRWALWTCLGLGLPQMREFIVRIEELPWLAIVFARRVAFVARFCFSGKLLVSRGIERVGSTSLRPRLGWVRSSLEANGMASEKFRSEPRADKERAGRA